MKDLRILIEIKGESVEAGKISGHDYSDARFRYSESYMSGKDSCPISVSLPFQSKAFSAEKTACFFTGLLPEGFMGKRVSELAHASSEDYIPVLEELGRECLGAIKVISEDDVPFMDYVKLSHDEVVKLAGEGVIEASEMVMKAHLSLTGASGKVGLYQDRETKEWFLPVGDAPSTHIVKQSHVRLDGIVTNEQLSIAAAGRLGIRVPATRIIDVGGYHDSEILLSTERYDRYLPEGGAGGNAAKVINGHAVPFRLHQEDFAQALGVPAIEKYEPEGGHYLKDAFDLIRDRSVDPVSDILKLWDIVVFDYLTGNTDNHIKNISMLYSPDLSYLSLAPAYDILSTAIYDSSTEHMAFRIGDDTNIRNITRDSFVKAADEVGLGSKIAMERFDTLREGFKWALDASAEELMHEGFINAGDIRDRILENGGISHV